MSMQKVSFTTLHDLIAQVDEIAKRRRRPRSFIITEAIENYLDNSHAKSTFTPAPKKKAGTR